MNNLLDDCFEIFTFRAIDEPNLCTKYIDGHLKTLISFGIANVSSNNSDWIDHQYTYCTVLRNAKTKEFLGGVRLQLFDGVYPLPIETAIGKMAPAIHDIVKQHAIRGGVGESCGLWLSKSARGMGFAACLMRALISSSSQLGFKRIVGLSGCHTLKLYRDVGFVGVEDNVIEKNGTIPYPTQDENAHVIEIDDLNTLEHASSIGQSIMLSLREKPVMTRTEKGKLMSFQVKYNLIYPIVSDGPGLKDDNYGLCSVEAMANLRGGGL